METIYSVKARHLISAAEQIERDARQSLRAWILIGQSERYGEAMRVARALRDAAAARSVWTRREILRSSGFVVKTPRQASGLG